MISKIIESIDHTEILNFYQNIENKISWLSGDKGKQSGLQFCKDEEEFISGCGKTDGKDFLFNILSDIYLNSKIEQIINKFQLVRTRWMWISPYSCYSIHRDVYPRIHIPLVTNNNCYFLFPDDENKIFHLPPGFIYWTNTRSRHTFVNCSEHPRLHLVGSTLA